MCIMGKTKIGDSSGMCRRMMRLDFWLTGMDGKNHGCMLVNIEGEEVEGGSGGRACDKGTQNGDDYRSEDVQDENEQNEVALCEEKEEGEGKEDGKDEDVNNEGNGDEKKGLK
ncbi:predicted protein [Sclerotinia sclerotiorum 1980 UF-70]|uniref:Uncharacterized protein n=1 Tax=Sclerotinia sclerotiorum (strain ATCC 18683 / 1980 / Ss-1) TaxID=665079 RepID=A7F8E9_SCLS1|nr:predicted protein [Sclerotinia sclerotiorum 1980 UF-70]EDN99020.1 predicted protein [Sclerotinia sclerotiorum 1980 UF-70]